MKNIITILVFGFFVFYQLDSTAQNWVNGGNNLSGSGRLGTISNQSLSLITNNTERARVTSSGNFGIGTSGPITKLHVNGFGSFGNRVTSSNATRALNLADDNAVMRVLRVDSSKAPAVELISRTSADGADVAYWDFYAQPSDASFRIRDRQGGGSGLDRVTISHANGNVGIGTTSPATKLEVQTGDNSWGVIHTNGSVSAGLYTGSFGGWLATKSNSPLYFCTSLLNTNNRAQMTLLTNGNFGVGTLNPQTKLEVQTADNSWGIVHTNGNVSGGFYVGSSGGWVATKSNSPLYFATSLLNKNFSAQMTLLTNGNLGVGTLNPSAKLYVTTQDQTTATYSATNAANGNGVTGEANNGTLAYGVWGKSTSGNGVVGQGNHYGVWGVAPLTGFAAFFTGNVHITGTSSWASDQKLKENIKPMGSILDKIMLLKPSSYNFKKEYNKMNLAEGEQMGFIAQDLEKVFPQLVKTIIDQQPDKEKQTEYKGVNYIELIPILTKAIQEQQEEISELKQEVNRLSGATAITQNTSSVKTIIVSDAVLNQNVPNPFSGSTSVQYNIPANSKSAQLVIADASGTVVKQAPLNKSGKGTVNIKAYNLSSGMYTYSLVVDGSTISSKKMIVGK